MISYRFLVAATLLANVAALSCGGGGGDSPSKPSNPVVTVRFIGPDGDSFSPGEVSLSRPRPGVSEHWSMHTWADGTNTDLGLEPLIPGEKYDVYVDSWGRPGVFASSTIRFTAPDGPIDLGTFDLRPLGFSMTSPAAGAVVTSYPVEFTWTAYANPAATYGPVICADAIANGCVFPSATHGTSYSLTGTKKAESITGQAAGWQMMVSFTTPEGYQVSHQTDTIAFAFPN